MKPPSIAIVLGHKGGASKGMAPESEGSSEDMDEESGAKDDASQMLIDAIKSGDKKQVYEAFESMMQVCGE